jgi:hypothetical protein
VHNYATGLLTNRPYDVDSPLNSHWFPRHS